MSKPTRQVLRQQMHEFFSIALKREDLQATIDTNKILREILNLYKPEETGDDKYRRVLRMCNEEDDENSTG